MDFDIPHLQQEFLLAGLGPPSPYKQIDLCRVVKRRFSFPSNKLEYVVSALGIGHKVKHEGFDLWIKCLAGDGAAWERMERYNKRDVTLLEDLYTYLLPWIGQHPSYAALTGDRVCPACGGSHVIKRGSYLTQVSLFQAYQCKDCGAYSRDVSANRVRPSERWRYDLCGRH
jgi:hypothetical protein